MSGTLYIHNSGTWLTFDFNGVSGKVAHISESNLPYAREAFETLGFELYQNRNRDSWTNEMMLIVKDPGNLPDKIVTDISEDIDIFAAAPPTIETKALAKLVDYLPAEIKVTQRSLEALQARRIPYGLS